MAVDKFGRSSVRPVMGRSGVTLKVANNIFLRRDGTNAVTGSINMNGNTLMNVSNPTDAQEVATKSYVDSNDASTRVSKSGDTMTGDLLLSVDNDTTRELGCLDLRLGKGFNLVLGNTRNRLQFRLANRTRYQGPITLETTHGFMVRVRNENVCQMGTKANPPMIMIHKNITMNSHKIRHLAEPTLPHEAATKDYVDRKVDLLPILSYDGHIPPLEANTSKTGFIVHASSYCDNDHQPWMAFNSGRIGEWVTRGEGAGAWLRIWCPTAVRIWKIRLTGRESNTERITRWKLSAGSGSIDSLTDIHTSDVELGATRQ